MNLARFKKGITLVELVIYIALLIAAVVLTVFIMVEVSRSYGKNRTDRLVGIAAETAMERIVREIRLACSIVSISSPVPNSLTLSTFSSLEGAGTCSSGPLSDRTILLDVNVIKISGNSLMPTGVTASSLEFTEITGDGAPTKAVRIKMELSSGSGSYQVTRKYYATATLRGSYAN